MRSQEEQTQVARKKRMEKRLVDVVDDAARLRGAGGRCDRGFGGGWKVVAKKECKANTGGMGRSARSATECYVRQRRGRIIRG